RFHPGDGAGAGRGDGARDRGHLRRGDPLALQRPGPAAWLYRNAGSTRDAQPIPDHDDLDRPDLERGPPVRELRPDRRSRRRTQTLREVDRWIGLRKGKAPLVKRLLALALLLAVSAT